MPISDYTKDKIWRMHHDQGMAKKQIARDLGIDIGTVRNVLNPGRKRRRAVNKANKHEATRRGRYNARNKVRTTPHDTPLIELLIGVIDQARIDATRNEKAAQWISVLQEDTKDARWDNQRLRKQKRRRWS